VLAADRGAKMLKFVGLINIVVLAVGATGCGDDVGCETICAKDDECRSDPFDADACTEICEELSDEDGAYANAIEEKAECYDDSTCQEIRAGECIPDES